MTHSRDDYNIAFIVKPQLLLGFYHLRAKGLSTLYYRSPMPSDKVLVIGLVR